MPKKIFNRLSVKVFLITFVMQILAGALICTVLYLRTPKTYLSSEEEDYVKVLALVGDLSEVGPEEGWKMIDDFISANHIDIAVYDGEKSTMNNKVFAETACKYTLKTKEEVENMAEQSEEGEVTYWFLNESSFWPDNGNKRYEIAFFIHNTKENVLPDSIRKSLPLMIGVITGISVVCSAVYTMLFAKPVNRISEVSRSMAQMDFTKKCDSKRNDEIGELARDLNTMAENLDEKIRSLNTRTEELEEEIRRREELESQKDMFFSAASHELKTPVTVLEGQIRGMLEGVGPYEDHDLYLSKSLGTVKRMESLINEILTASRMQSGQEIVMSRADMAQILEEKTKECEELFEVRKMKMQKKIGQDLVFAGNQDMTAMAVGALLSNAVFYSADGQTVFVNAGKESGKIIVTIRNTGAHISEEDLPHLFEPFYRTDKSRSRRSGGSGLGLYLAELIIKKQGGFCMLENDGEDVLATIVLPSSSDSGK